MARLIGGIGIYLSVLLLLVYASATHAMEPLIADPAGMARQETAEKVDMTAFDLTLLEARPYDALAAHARDGVEPVLRAGPGFGRNDGGGKTGRRLTGPTLSYHAGKRGPVIELGVLGGTVKPRQRLAHLALDWNF